MFKQLLCFCLVVVFLFIETAYGSSVRIGDRKGVVEAISSRSGLSMLDAEKLFREIYIAAIDHYYYDPYMDVNLDFCEYFSIVLGIIDVESAFDRFAIAKVKKKYTGVGLMQINFSYWKKRSPDLEIEYLYNPYVNVRIGSRILLLELMRLKSLEKALAVYVGGSSYTTGKANEYIQRVEAAKDFYRRYVCPLQLAKNSRENNLETKQ